MIRLIYDIEAKLMIKNRQAQIFSQIIDGLQRIPLKKKIQETTFYTKIIGKTYNKKTLQINLK